MDICTECGYFNRNQCSIGKNTKAVNCDAFIKRPHIETEEIKMSEKTTATVVKFDKPNIMAYLDTAIIYWRGKREKALQMSDAEMDNVASVYIDAFQSVRTSLFGDTLHD